MAGWIGGDGDAIVEPYMQEGFRAKPPRRRRRAPAQAGGEMRAGAWCTAPAECLTTIGAMDVVSGSGSAMAMDAEAHGGTKRACAHDEHHEGYDGSVQRTSSRQRMDGAAHHQQLLAQQAPHAQPQWQQHMRAPPPPQPQQVQHMQLQLHGHRQHEPAPATAAAVPYCSYANTQSTSTGPFYAQQPAQQPAPPPTAAGSWDDVMS